MNPDLGRVLTLNRNPNLNLVSLASSPIARLTYCFGFSRGAGGGVLFSPDGPCFGIIPAAAASFSFGTGRSCSSSMSPTISSSTSSSVISPRICRPRRERAPSAGATCGTAARRWRPSRRDRGTSRGRARPRAAPPRTAEQEEQVLRVDDADDVVQLAVVDRHARVGAAADDLQHLVGRRVQLQRRHLLARHHAVADALVGQAEDVLDHVRRVGVDDAGLLAVLDQEPEFLDRVDLALLAACLDSRADGGTSCSCRSSGG